MIKWTHSLKGPIKVEVLGPEDFEGYERNKPNDQWELIRLPDGVKVWEGKRWLKDTKEEVKDPKEEQ